MTHQLYLKTARQTIPVDVTPTEAGLLIAGDGIRFEIVGPGAIIQTIIAPPLPTRRAVDVLAMTPLDVVRYFEQSPVLCIYADDLKSDFKAYQTPPADTTDLQLQQDVEAVQHLKSPSLADISEILTGSRQYGGATYTRVKAVKQALNSTTTTENGPELAVEVEKAA
jgi:hypothetical protein